MSGKYSTSKQGHQPDSLFLHMENIPATVVSGKNPGLQERIQPETKFVWGEKTLSTMQNVCVASFPFAF